MIKTFRGLLTDGGQDRIRLSTKKGKRGYKILKFQAMTNEPGSAESTNVVKLYKILQTTVNGKIDFTDGNLLGAIDFRQHDNEGYGISGNMVIFEQEVFNQDVYITNKDNNTGVPVNYYLELESFNMTDNAAAVSTLRDIRLNPQVGA